MEVFSVGMLIATEEPALRFYSMTNLRSNWTG